MMPIIGYDVGDILYVDIRSYGHAWYDDMLPTFPDRFTRTYVLQYEIMKVTPKYVTAYVPTYDEFWNSPRGRNCLDAYWCYAWGACRVLNRDNMTLVTPDLCLAYPEIISADPAEQRRVLNKHGGGRRG